MEQTILTLPGQLRLPPVLVGFVLADRYFSVVCFVDRSLYFFFWPLCFLSFLD